MGTRNQRLRPQDFDSHWDSLKGKRLHVVTHQGTTLSGKVVDLSPAQITLQDSNAAWYNRKKHTHILHRENILEIILDLVSPY
jgi:hypothetical protein